MTADQLGDNRPQLPKSDEELTQQLHSLAGTIRTSLNDHIHILVPLSDSSHMPGLGRQQLIRVPSLGDIITVFGLEMGINWQLEGVAQKYSPDYQNGISGNKQELRGFDGQNRRVFDGEMALDLTSDQPEKSFQENVDSRRYYGTSFRVRISRYHPDGLERNFGLHYDGPLDIGHRHPGRFLSYCDGREGLLIYYQAPSFEVPDSALNHNFIQEPYRDPQGFVWEDQEKDIPALIEQESGVDDTYSRLIAALASDEGRWKSQPEESTMYKISELARFLESKYRHRRGITEFTYKEYVYRITALQDYIWLLYGHGKFNPKRPFNSDGKWRLISEYPVENKYSPSFSYRALPDLPSCPYPNIVFPGDLCITRCTVRLCPRGLGPFDPGPHNPSAPNDPRGRDPRGLFDPRGPR